MYCEPPKQVKSENYYLLVKLIKYDFTNFGIRCKEDGAVCN